MKKVLGIDILKLSILKSKYILKKLCGQVSMKHLQSKVYCRHLPSITHFDFKSTMSK